MPTSIGDLIWVALLGIIGLLISLIIYTFRNLVKEVGWMKKRMDNMEKIIPDCKSCMAEDLEKMCHQIIESIKDITGNQKELRDRLPKEYLRIEFYQEVKEDIKEIKETIKEIFKYIREIK